MEHSRILIVDDEPANVRLLERILSRANFPSLKTVCDPREALSTFIEFEPDLVLLDLHMPHLDGFGVMEQLKTVIPPESFVPILVLTADVTSQAKLRALSAGADDFLTKPFDKSEAVLRVTNLLRMRRLQQQVQDHNVRLEQMVSERTVELQRALQKLENTQQQVIQQERLRALGLMASGVAHDFNNALSIILGFSEILLLDCEDVPEREPMAQHLQTIVTAALDGAEMVTRLREFYRPPGTIEERRVAVNLNELVTQSVNLTQPKWKSQALSQGKTIEVQTTLADVPPVAGDAAELREVLTNVIFNAVDAMPHGGTIELQTSLENGCIVLRVCDTGTGMPEEVRKRCLEPFFTTKGEGGTGLGLAMVYGIIERHGGTMEIESTPGLGTKFIFRLPQQETIAVNGNGAPHLEQLMHVLVADDQPVLCEVLAEYLRHDWHTVDVVANGTEALERCEGATYDLVLTDLAMPGIPGDQLATTIKTRWPSTRVILVTGFSDLGPGMSASLDHVDHILRKPVSLLDLRQAIGRVMSLPNGK